MPFDAWLLLIVSVGLGLVLEVMYVRAQRARGFDDDGSRREDV